MDGGAGDTFGHLSTADRMLLSLQGQNHGFEVKVNVKIRGRHVVHFRKVVLKWNVCFIYAHHSVRMNPHRHQLCCGHITVGTKEQEKDFCCFLFSNK